MEKKRHSHHSEYTTLNADRSCYGIATPHGHISGTIAHAHSHPATACEKPPVLVCMPIQTAFTLPWGGSNVLHDGHRLLGTQPMDHLLGRRRAALPRTATKFCEDMLMMTSMSVKEEVVCLRESGSPVSPVKTNQVRPECRGPGKACPCQHRSGSTSWCSINAVSVNSESVCACLN
jgi:hypothetical protein